METRDARREALYLQPSPSRRSDGARDRRLAALWDAAFDAGLVSFDDDGRPLFSTALTPTATEALIVQTSRPLPLTGAHRSNLAQPATRSLPTRTPKIQLTFRKEF